MANAFTQKKVEKEKISYTPIVLALAETITEQIEAFLDADDDARVSMSPELFNCGWPCSLNAEKYPDLQGYTIWLLERTINYDPKSPRPISCLVLATDDKTHMPTATLSARITFTRSELATVTVYTHEGRGTLYRNTYRWKKHGRKAPAGTEIAPKE